MDQNKSLKNVVYRYQVQWMKKRISTNLIYFYMYLDTPPETYKGIYII